MNPYLVHCDLSPVTKLLSNTFDKVIPLRYGRWTVNGDAPWLQSLTVCLDQQWLIFESQLPALTKSDQGLLENERWYQCLHMNKQLAGGVKFGFRPQEKSFSSGEIKKSPLGIFAEIPFIEERAQSSLVQEVAKGYRQAWKFLEMGFVTPIDPQEDVSSVEGEDQEGNAMRASQPCSLDVKQMCQETGWSCIASESGRARVSLKTTHGFSQANVVEDSQAVRCWVEFENTSLHARGSSKMAIVILGLRLCGSVRLMRVFLEHRNSEPVLEMECILPRPVSPSQFIQALTSLSLACELGGRELVLLNGDEELAHVVVARQGCYANNASYLVPLEKKEWGN